MSTIPAVLRDAATRAPDAEAVVTDEVRLTFAELATSVEEFARAARASGVRPGDRIGIWAPNTARWVIAALGLVSAGAVLVPVNTRFKGEEAHHVLASTGASLLVVDEPFLSELLGAPPTTTLGDLPALRTVVSTAEESEHGESWSGFLERAQEVSRDDAQRTADAVSSHDACDIIFTSGTTGRPKGVIVTHGQSVRLFQCWADTVGVRPGDRMLVVAPFFHTFGYKAGLLACLLQTATLVPLKVFDTSEAARLIECERITVVPGPPTLYSSLLELPDLDNRDLSFLRLAVTGAAVVPTALIRRMRDELAFETVITAYGLSESCGFATSCRPGDADEVLSTTSGRAVDGVDVVVAGPDGARLPPGEPGEVLIRGYNVMSGYWQDPEATAEAIDADGWLHTGDVGVLDAGGNLRITDRLKDMYVVGGFNAYPAEIEQVLVRHEAVSEAAVIGVPDERLGEVGRAYVVARAGAQVEPDELVAWCRERLANYKVPRSVQIVDALPRNATGKVAKTVLRDQARTRA
jgi:acyl-CoA synthetase (AMP-forming)/AMP-acid ligase II